MIVVRQVFQAKFGHAREVVAAMRSGLQAASASGGPGSPHRWRLLTDLSGPFDTVVLEVEAESLAAWEQARAAMFADPRWQAQQRRGMSALQGGRGELYTIEASSDQGT